MNILNCSMLDSSHITSLCCMDTSVRKSFVISKNINQVVWFVIQFCVQMSCSIKWFIRHFHLLKWMNGVGHSALWDTVFQSM